MRICEVESCNNKHLAKGHCKTHYTRMRRHGTIEKLTMRGEPVIDRIKAKIRITRKRNCWIFLGTLTGSGYGFICHDGKMRCAHVVTYEIKYGEIPKGKELDHFFCKVKRCCNPDHVEPVTHVENVRRGNCAKVARARLMKLSPRQRSMRGRKAANERWRNHK